MHRVRDRVCENFLRQKLIVKLPRCPAIIIMQTDILD